MDEKTKAKLHSSLIVIVAIALMLSGFFLVWGEKASHVRTVTAMNYSSEGENVTLQLESVITFENYFPVRQMLGIEFHISSLNAYTGEESEGLDVWDSESLKVYGITVDKTQFQSFYGDEALGPPSTVTGDVFVSQYGVSAFTKMVVSVSWNYSRDLTDPTDIRIVRLRAKQVSSFELHDEVEDKDTNILVEGYDYLRLVTRSYFFEVLLPVALFISSGGTIAVALRKKIYDLREALRYISKLSLEDLRAGGLDESALKELTYKPNLLGYIPNIFFAPAVALLKISIRRWVTRLLYEARIKGIPEKTLKPLTGLLKEDSTKPSGKLIELKSVGLILAFLVSLGVTLAFNVGAIAPVLYAVGLTYLFCNLGFLLYLVRKSTPDFYRSIIFVIVGIAVVALPRIILDVRVFM